MTRGSELKKASRREPSVWMQSNLEKKGEKEGGREGGGGGKERASFLFFLAEKYTQIYLSFKLCT